MHARMVTAAIRTARVVLPADGVASRLRRARCSGRSSGSSCPAVSGGAGSADSFGLAGAALTTMLGDEASHFGGTIFVPTADERVSVALFK